METHACAIFIQCTTAQPHKGINTGKYTIWMNLKIFLMSEHRHKTLYSMQGIISIFNKVQTNHQQLPKIKIRGRISYQEKSKADKNIFLGWVCMYTYVNVIDCISLNKIIIIEKEKRVSSKQVKAGKWTFNLDRDCQDMQWWGGREQMKPTCKISFGDYYSRDIWTNKLISFYLLFH